MGKLGRVGAALAATALLVGTAALPAAAEAARGRLTGGEERGPRVNMVGAGAYVPVLFDLKLNGGGHLKVYCVEIKTDIDRDQDMVEHPWDSYPNPDSPFHENRELINWVLHHGYPFKSVEDLNKLELDLSADGLSKGEAIAGTQAAVWHFSDGVDLDPADASPDGNDQDIKALYEYLVKNAKDLGEQPTPVLEINPEAAEGKTGELVGPFTVTTNGTITEIAKELPEGVELTDKDGKPVTEADVKDGTELYLKVPADAEAGEGGFSLTTLSKVDVGRLFVGERYAEKPAQSLIVAESSETKAQDSALGKWTVAPPTTTPPAETTTTTAPPAETTTTAPAPTTTPAPAPGDDLPDTGANILIPVLVGLGLLGAGAGALIWQRRRKAA